MAITVDIHLYYPHHNHSRANQLTGNIGHFTSPRTSSRLSVEARARSTATTFTSFSVQRLRTRAESTQDELHKYLESVQCRFTSVADRYVNLLHIYLCLLWTELINRIAISLHVNSISDETQQ
jgi:hypothetical protein